jgi:hypothetical protein
MHTAGRYAVTRTLVNQSISGAGLGLSIPSITWRELDGAETTDAHTRSRAEEQHVSAWAVVATTAMRP